MVFRVSSKLVITNILQLKGALHKGQINQSFFFIEEEVEIGESTLEMLFVTAHSIHRHCNDKIDISVYKLETDGLFISFVNKWENWTRLGSTYFSFPKK